MVDHSICDILHVDGHDNPMYWAEVVPILSHEIAFFAPPLLCSVRVGIAVDKTLFFPSGLENPPDAIY
ncbi:hypothetical protein L873DRAFT_1824356 [Choiromyces venosus 120613-1]|uniref:Uncharacterized protein n=1 Tax=Choiromyces venosus 120613-1 TaxID=1336337 RepID=A0A3N4IRW8_9PEZI|nr:hypothetical protein L873DRAFT_1824356 [Choiromyces venosus 120613-1]